MHGCTALFKVVVLSFSLVFIARDEPLALTVDELLALALYELLVCDKHT